MENNKQSLQLARGALGITLFIWFILLTVGLPIIHYLVTFVILLAIPTFLNIESSFEKTYESSFAFVTLIATLLSYIIAGIILISFSPILGLFVLGQIIFLLLACLTFKGKKL